MTGLAAGFGIKTIFFKEIRFAVRWQFGTCLHFIPEKNWIGVERGI
jgi:hypothetical protein